MELERHLQTLIGLGLLGLAFLVVFNLIKEMRFRDYLEKEGRVVQETATLRIWNVHSKVLVIEDRSFEGNCVVGVKASSLDKELNEEPLHYERVVRGSFTVLKFPEAPRKDRSRILLRVQERCITETSAFKILEAVE